jgi:hypothetical protein
MSKAGIDRLIANAKKHFTINDDQQVAEFRARQHFFPSTLKGDRSFVSPLGGQAVSKPEPQTKAQKPSGDGWW